MSMQVTKKVTTKTTVTRTTTTGGGPPVTESHSTRKVSIATGKGSLMDTFGKDLALEGDIEEQMKRLKDDLHMKALEPSGSGREVIKVDDSNITDFFNKDRNKLNLNLDIQGLKSETLKVKSVGNKIEVHGEKMSKTTDGESKEEYSRTFELPSPVEPDTIKPSMFKEGVLTVELPIPPEALQPK